jgi:hypothetical protein
MHGAGSSEDSVRKPSSAIEPADRRLADRRGVRTFLERCCTILDEPGIP